MLRNFLTLSTGVLLARGIHAIAILLLVRILKPDALGIFELAVSIAAYASLAVQQGFDAIAIRETSKHPREVSHWLAAVTRLRLAFAIPVTIAMLLAGLLQMQRPIGSLLMILSLSIMAGAFNLRWVYLAFETPRAPVLAGILSQAVFLGTVVFAVRSPEHVWRAALGWAAGEIAAAVVLRAGRTHAGAAGRGGVSTKDLLRKSWPVSVSMLLGQIMLNFDVVALAAMGKQSEIGLYLAAYRCVTGFTPLLQQFEASLSPPFARAHLKGQELRVATGKMAAWGAAAGLGISLILYLGSGILMEKLFGRDYLPAVTYLRQLVWILPLRVVRMVFRQALIAMHRQVSDTKVTAMGAAATVILDLLLIPTMGADGCVVAALCSSVILAASSWYFVNRDLPQSSH